MRKEVFYSLMAMTVVPVAANARVVNGDATPGTVVPDAISFDNLVRIVKFRFRTTIIIIQLLFLFPALLPKEKH